MQFILLYLSVKQHITAITHYNFGSVSVSLRFKKGKNFPLRSLKICPQNMRNLISVARFYKVSHTLNLCVFCKKVAMIETKWGHFVLFQKLFSQLEKYFFLTGEIKFNSNKHRDNTYFYITPHPFSSVPNLQTARLSYAIAYLGGEPLLSMQ